MGVSVDTSGNEKFVGAVNDFCILVGYVAGDFCNFAILNENITLLRKICIYDSCVLQKIALSESDVKQ